MDLLSPSVCVSLSRFPYPYVFVLISLALSLSLCLCQCLILSLCVFAFLGEQGEWAVGLPLADQRYQQMTLQFLLPPLLPQL